MSELAEFLNGATKSAGEARLSEAHHRIANHLALIAGFVRLQASAVARAGHDLSPIAARRALEEVGVRIETVGRLHRMLSQGGDEAAVDLGGYLEGTCEILAQSMSFDSPVDLACQASRCEASAERAGLVGLIVTELVTNAVKYAHPAGAPGRIQVRCRGHADGALSLSVADDGVGLPEDFDPICDGGLGLRVVRSLARQMDGELPTFESTPLGLTVHLDAPAEPLCASLAAFLAAG